MLKTTKFQFPVKYILCEFVSCEFDIGKKVVRVTTFLFCFLYQYSIIEIGGRL